MPAVKKELPGREDLALALATFHPSLAALPLPPLPSYLAPLPAAAALPPTASLPAAAADYEALLAPPLRAPRAYLSLHEAGPHLHLPRDPLVLERFSAAATVAPDFQPLLDNGEPCIEVECGANRALLYVRKLCQGSKGPSIRHRGEWLTPNEFQFVSGRETAKDWKRSIRHKGKSLKTLMSKGLLQVHPPICDCPGCRISSPVNRGRLADKRTTALPPTRVLKKELTPGFAASDGDSDGSGPACCRQPATRKGDGPARVVKRRAHTHWDVNISFRETSCSQDSDLPTLISSVHRSRHLVMPEPQGCCEFQRGSVELGLGATGDLLSKRLGRASHTTSDFPLEKKARSESPPETLLLPELGSGMAPEDHYRRLISALSEASTFEDPQRLYHLGVPSHDLQRVRQEAAATAMRSPSSLEVHLPPATAGQRRKQGLAQHREGAAPAAALPFPDRPQGAADAPPSCPRRPSGKSAAASAASRIAPNYAPPGPAGSTGRGPPLARPARELSHPPPLLSSQNAPHIALGPHLRPPFLGVPAALCQTPGYGFLPPAQAEVFARQQELLRKQNLARLEMSAELLRQDMEEPQLLAPEPTLRPSDGAEELQRHRAMLVLRHSSAPLLALPSQGPPTPPREPALRAPRKGGSGSASAQPSESKETTASGLWTQDSSEDEPPKNPDRQDTESAAVEGRDPTPGQAPGGGRASLSGSTLPPPLPLGLPYAVSPCFHTGALGGPEDVSRWTVDDVCSFVGGLAGCGEYATVFREQGIDGETLPLLTEEHLLTTMGLKLGPALKIRAQVAKRLGRIFYTASFPVTLPLQPPTLQAPPECELLAGEQPSSPATVASPKQENRTAALLPGATDPCQPLC